MAHPPELRAKLRATYVHDRLNMELAAEKVGVSYATARRWKSDAENEGDDWEKARSVARISADGMQTVAQMLAADFVPVHQSVMEEIRSAAGVDPLKKAEALAKLADAVTKTAAAIGRFSPEMSRLAAANDCMKAFGEFVMAEHPHLAEGLLEAMEAFIPVLTKEFA